MDTLVSCGLTADSCNNKNEVKKYQDFCDQALSVTVKSQLAITLTSSEKS